MVARMTVEDEKPAASAGPKPAAPHYHGHRQRLRDRFLEAGPAALTDYELLELILFRAIPRRDVKPLAKDLLKKFGSFAEVVSASPARLAGVAGLGEAAIAELKVVQAAAQRLARGEINRREVLSSWSAVLDYCRGAMAFADREQFRVLFLDKRNQLIADEVQQEGTVDHTPVYPREVVKRALELSATAHHPGAQPPVGRPDTVARRRADDQVGDRRGEALRHRGARPHHRRQGRPCQPEGAGADLSSDRSRREHAGGLLRPPSHGILNSSRGRSDPAS